MYCSKKQTNFILDLFYMFNDLIVNCQISYTSIRLYIVIVTKGPKNPTLNKIQKNKMKITLRIFLRFFTVFHFMFLLLTFHRLILFPVIQHKSSAWFKVLDIIYSEFIPVTNIPKISVSILLLNLVFFTNNLQYHSIVFLKFFF